MTRKITYAALFVVGCFFISTPASASQEGWAKVRLTRMLGPSIPLDLLKQVFSDSRFQINAPRIISPQHPASVPISAGSEVERGRRFWWEHHAALGRAYSVYGVPPEVVVAILRRENNLGIHLGEHEVLNTLATRSLLSKGNKKAKSLQRLECFLRLSIQERWDPFAIVGSSEGAFSLPQFMPCSYAAYAVDGNGDGIVDPMHDWDDAILSVANFLRQNGWSKDEDRRRQALFAYNRSTEYVRGVLGYARDVRG